MNTMHQTLSKAGAPERLAKHQPPAKREAVNHQVIYQAVAVLFGLGLAILAASIPGHLNAAPQPEAVMRTTVPGSATMALPSFANIVERVVDAVVNINVEQSVQAGQSGPSILPPGLPEDSPLSEFFRRFHAEPDFSKPREGEGSGFIIDPAGLIVTNNHVVQGADRIRVTLNNGDEYPAQLLGRDPKTDLALIKIDAPAPLTAVQLGSAEGARVGDWVLAVGNPFGLGGSVSAGIISARGRDINSGPYDDYLQIDAPINRGNSGGPLFDASGRVIGVNTAIFSPSGGNIGIGFAIPAETVADIVTELRTKGRVDRGWLGVQIQPVTDEVASSLGLSERQGVLVTEVLPEGPAAAAGLRDGDIILRVDGQVMQDYRDLTRLIASLDAGSQVQIALIRGGQGLTLPVTIGQMPTEPQLADSGLTNDGDQARLGVYLAPITPETRRELNLSPGTAGVLVTDVEPNSPAARAGIRAGAVISMVGQQPVSTPEQAISMIRAAASQGRPSVLLRLEQDGQQRFVPVPFQG
ncbi:Do family serine endopeptidase [Thiorhodovibrio frisius]|uniref:Periplasmic serine protease, Do/DeqQ family n=1 Tax=Thiorhodovibrio frisius TaxID=631362 RepID=H8YYH8_9GAMM|nr:Do family serine endopeptidase [Thiorhodovibrio frisius]EIC23504.1 periplasmic serine protease, Do/DeqQ family [Thiorhodovibrio frisius]WPL23409.1 putative periplasmic serine endoprotease DegP-like precursor [Thiorhodovibrio frisius]